MLLVGHMARICQEEDEVRKVPSPCEESYIHRTVCRCAVLTTLYLLALSSQGQRIQSRLSNEFKSIIAISQKHKYHFVSENVFLNYVDW